MISSGSGFFDSTTGGPGVICTGTGMICAGAGAIFAGAEVICTGGAGDTLKSSLVVRIDTYFPFSDSGGGRRIAGPGGIRLGSLLLVSLLRLVIRAVAIVKFSFARKSPAFAARSNNCRASSCVF
jgi:hypothetical protein